MVSFDEERKKDLLKMVSFDDYFEEGSLKNGKF